MTVLFFIPLEHVDKFRSMIGVHNDYDSHLFRCSKAIFDKYCVPIIKENKITGYESLWDNKYNMDHTFKDIANNSFESICNELISLQKDKNLYYGESYSKNVSKYGLIAGLIPISNKFNRLEILCNNPHAVESIEDTLKDLACYAIMMLEEVYKTNNQDEYRTED